MGWQELGEGIYRRSYESLRLNIGIVLGENGALVVDTRESHRMARELAGDVAELTTLPIRWVVNTHFHWDHTFGNALFAVERWGHERCRERLLTEQESARADAISWFPDRADEFREVEVTPPDRTFTTEHRIDLGGRTVELQYLGLGHTDNDIVVWVADTQVVFAGDLIEEGGPPYMGDAFPMSWPDTLSRLEEGGPEIIVPGHGDVVELEYAAEQRAALAGLADLARTGWANETPAKELARRGPFPVETMTTALERAYAELAGAT